MAQSCANRSKTDDRLAQSFRFHRSARKDLTHQRREEIDVILSDLASGWKLERQAAVDRNILRLAALEMLFIPEIPFTASINEAVELAKKYSTAESGRFC